MVHDERRGWSPADPQSSPPTKLNFVISGQSYSALGLATRQTKSCKTATTSAIFDTEAQMDILPVRMVTNLGTRQEYLFPVGAMVGGHSAEPM